MNFALAEQLFSMLAAIGVLALPGVVSEAELVEVLYQEVVGGVVVGQIVDG